MQPVRVLLLWTNPSDSDVLQLNAESQRIVARLQNSAEPNAFQIRVVESVRPEQLLDLCNEYQPKLIHFGGHGTASGDLLFESEHGLSHAVSPEALAAALENSADTTQIVLLNACHSFIPAARLAQFIPFVVAMRAAIADEAALVFAEAFYAALACQRSIPNAFAQGVAALRLAGLPDHDLPLLYAHSTEAQSAGSLRTWGERMRHAASWLRQHAGRFVTITALAGCVALLLWTYGFPPPRPDLPAENTADRPTLPPPPVSTPAANPTARTEVHQSTGDHGINLNGTGAVDIRIGGDP